MTEILAVNPEHKLPQHKLPRRAFGWRSRARAAPPTHTQPAVKPKRTLTATLREWHKRAGLGAFLFMAWLGISGILLNQSASWGLDAARIDWPWMMALYGLHATSPDTGFSADGHWLAVAGDHAVLDGKALTVTVKPPLGFAVGGELSQRLLFVAAADNLLLLTPDGSRKDELQPSLTLPVKTIRRIGTVEGPGGRVAIEDQGLFASSDGEVWTPIPSTTRVHWSEEAPLSADQHKQFERHARPSVAVEQILIDLHSGRLFGRYGSYVINMVGLAATWLAISGVWMMWRTSQARRRNPPRR
jgi:hypothetical protein